MKTVHVLTLLLFQVLVGCSGAQTHNQKINGLSFVAPPRELSQEAIEPLISTNANWAAVMPFGFMAKPDTTAIVFNVERQWWGERVEGAKKTVEMLHAKGIKVMLKPQIWVWRGEFTGHIAMEDEEKWQKFEKSYEDFILEYASLANECNAELFCIGTELNSFVVARPEFWVQLIKKVRTVYKGKLTYAENWDTFQKVHFWPELDFIGVDAYFPISGNKTPTVSEARKGWDDHKKSLVEVHKKYSKPILFTEFGYRSLDYSGKEPWNANRSTGNINHGAQLNLLTALFEEFWQEPWFAGGFLWKWFPNHHEAGGESDNQFTIQNKPAQSFITQQFGK